MMNGVMKFLSASAWYSDNSLRKALPDDLTRSVVHFQPSKNAASKYILLTKLFPLTHFCCRICNPIKLHIGLTG